MSRLSDKKLALLQSDYGNSLWYITKQNCSFRDLMMMASILERWNDDPNESFETFFNRVKTETRYSNYIGSSPHRALKNCEFYGIMSPSSSSKAAYTSSNLTDVYYTVKSLCNEDYAETNVYQQIIDKQIENMNISVDGNDLKPVLFTLKVMLVVGDATGNYELSLQEFKLFVCTAKEWCQYFESAESILRSREDSEYLSSALQNYDIANDTRFNLVLKNLSYVESTTKSIAIAKDKIEKIRKKVAEFEVGEVLEKKGNQYWVNPVDSYDIKSDIQNYLTAIRTKPFLLLAGISGTGKSRIVRELAFKSCPKYLQDKEGTTPGNYCMIEVKPNWHDSTELLGYYSRLGQAGYQFKKFVMFLVKAKMFPKVPFFVCLDEMNLAPVEHYFAEILSILETRKHPKIAGTDGVDMEVIKTDPIVEARYFRELGRLSNTRNSETGQAYSATLTDRDIYMKLYGIDTESDIDPEVGQRTDLTTKGLTLPDNVIIIGTVNMDDTTHQFSRKVIDRAMTIEMNGGKLSDMYGGSKNLEYLDEAEQQKWQAAFKQRYVTADEVLEKHSEVADDIIKKVPERLEKINEALKGTLFEVSYRVLNELTIMIGVMLDDPSIEGDVDAIIDKAIDRILLMKILPRIEGDADMFNLSREFKSKHEGINYNNRLEWLKELAPDIATDVNEPHQQTAREKIQEMIERLENQEFTRFWP